jgi:hypothetical protein
MRDHDVNFTVDGTMIEANASLKSFRKKDGGNPPDGSGSNPELRSAKRHRRRTVAMSRPPQLTRRDSFATLR